MSVPWCPRCFTTFDNEAKLSKHIRRNECEPAQFDGGDLTAGDLDLTPADNAEEHIDLDDDDADAVAVAPDPRAIERGRKLAALLAAYDVRERAEIAGGADPAEAAVKAAASLGCPSKAYGPRNWEVAALIVGSDVSTQAVAGWLPKQHRNTHDCALPLAIRTKADVRRLLRDHGSRLGLGFEERSIYVWDGVVSGLRLRDGNLVSAMTPHGLKRGKVVRVEPGATGAVHVKFDDADVNGGNAQRFTERKKLKRVEEMKVWQCDIGAVMRCAAAHRRAPPTATLRPAARAPTRTDRSHARRTLLTNLETATDHEVGARHDDGVRVYDHPMCCDWYIRHQGARHTHARGPASAAAASSRSPPPPAPPPLSQPLALAATQRRRRRVSAIWRRRCASRASTSSRTSRRRAGRRSTPSSWCQTS